MAFTPVDVTNGVDIRTVQTAGDLNQAIWDGWLPVGGPVPPVFTSGDPGTPSVVGFLDVLAETFVSKQELVISPVRPTTAPDGTVHIKNAV